MLNAIITHINCFFLPFILLNMFHNNEYQSINYLTSCECTLQHFITKVVFYVKPIYTKSVLGFNSMFKSKFWPHRYSFWLNHTDFEDVNEQNCTSLKFYIH